LFPYILCEYGYKRTKKWTWIFMWNVRCCIVTLSKIRMRRLKLANLNIEFPKKNFFSVSRVVTCEQTQQGKKSIF
jgi:hypothetical protein